MLIYFKLHSKSFDNLCKLHSTQSGYHCLVDPIDLAQIFSETSIVVINRREACILTLKFDPFYLKRNTYLYGKLGFRYQQFVYITRSNLQRIECSIGKFTALAETKARKMKRFQIFLHKQPQINKQALIDTCRCRNR